MAGDKHLTYKDAGVDIDAGNALVERIKPIVKTTRRPGVLGGIGGFGGMFELDVEKYRHPVLVSGTDGVGTKLKLAIELNHYDTIGIDLVAMCANDIIVLGAEPLFFLDYYATGALDVETGASIVAGIADGCRQSGAALLGGETAELPGLYADNDFDLAGFCVGVVDRDQIIDSSGLQDGDILLGLASSGPHSNGYSLIRRVLELHPEGPGFHLDGRPAGELLLEPTRIYVRAILALIKACRISAIAHITGGGLPENVVRVLPDTLDARIDSSAWVRPTVFDWLQDQGQIEESELLRTFNCGIGMVIAIRPEEIDNARATLDAAGETVFEIGSVTTGSGRVLIEP